MSRTGFSPPGKAQPPPHRSTFTRRPRGDGRLDPVRWHRPGRGTLLRLAAVAVLLATAAAVSWSPQTPCGPASPAPTLATGPSTSSSTRAVPEGSVGVPIRLADPTALSLVHAGNHVDLLRLGHDGGQTTAVASAALVLRVTGMSDPTTGGLLLALNSDEANKAEAASPDGFAIVIRPG
jgi:hypothetical protein